MSIAETMPPKVAASPVAPTIGTTDGELLLRFAKHGCQQSFARLVDEHGPLVWATCRQVLCHHDDIEDAFQATFLILARRAKDIRASDSAAPWLYRVAYRTSLALSRHRRTHPTLPLGEREVLDDRPDPLEHLHQQHMVAVLVEELRALPDRYQAPLVLCYLEGRSRTAVAEVLDCTVATVKGRLARGRQLLRQRLARRGVALSLAATAAAAAVTQAKTALAGSTLPAATASAALTPITPAGDMALSTTVSQLVQQGASAMTYASLMKPVAAVAATLLLGVATAVALDEPAPEVAQAGPPAVIGSDLTVQLEAAATDSDAAPVAEEETTPSVVIAANGPPGTQPAMAPKTSLDNFAVPQRAAYPSPAMDTLHRRNDVLITTGHAPPATIHMDGRHIAQLELMQKHWEAKAEGLRLKADALARQAQQDNDPMKIAEAKLAEADAYEADAERLGVEAEIARRQQPRPVRVDPVVPQRAQPTGKTPAEALRSTFWPGSLLRLLVERQDEGAEHIQTAYVLQIDSEGRVSLPWAHDEKLEVKDLEQLENQIAEHLQKDLELKTPAKVRHLSVTIRPMRPEGQSPTPAGSERSDEIEQMRRDVEQLRRELDSARPGLAPRNAYGAPSSPPPATVPAPPTPPNAVPLTAPPRSDEWQPNPNAPVPAQSADDELREEIQRLREHIQRLEQKIRDPESSVLNPHDRDR